VCLNSRNSSDEGKDVLGKKQKLSIGEGGKCEECAGEEGVGRTHLGSEQGIVDSTDERGKDCSSGVEKQGVEASSSAAAGGTLSGLVAYCDSSDSSDTED
jgi:hypothetical protein